MGGPRHPPQLLRRTGFEADDYLLSECQGALEGCLGRSKFVQPAAELREELAAADEVDDLVAVAWLYFGLTPLRTRQDFEVAFDGHAAGRKI